MDVPRITVGLLLNVNALLALLLHENHLLGEHHLKELGVVAFATLAVIPAAFTLSSVVFFGLALFATLSLATVLFAGLCAWGGGKRGKLSTDTNRGTWLTGGLLALLSLAACSNSFVVQEARSLAFLLQSLVVVAGFSVVSGNLHDFASQ